MPWNTLRPFLAGSDAESESAIGRLKAFTVELLKWNRGISNLVSHDDERRLVERHIAESLAGAAIVRELGCNELLDLGSGGGFPALPLALAGVGRRWTLVESRRNKTLFLRKAVQELALANVSVLTARLEAIVEEQVEGLQCDGFTSRATMRAGPTLELAARIVRPGGHAILWKGSGLDDELSRSRGSWERQWAHVATHRIADGPNSIAVFSLTT